MTKDTITIGGETMTVEGYLAKEDGKRKKRDASIHYRKDLKTLHRITKKQAPRSKGRKEQSGVIYTKRFTKREIRREDLKRMANRKKGNLRVKVLEWIMEQQGRHYTTKDLLARFPESARATLSAVQSRFYSYLNSEGLMVRRKAGQGFEYKFNATVQKPSEEAPLVYEDYLKWERAMVEERRSAGDPGPSEGLVVPGPSEKPLVEQGYVSNVPQEIKVTVNVSGAIRFLFGLGRVDP